MQYCPTLQLCLSYGTYCHHNRNVKSECSFALRIALHVVQCVISNQKWGKPVLLFWTVNCSRWGKECMSVSFFTSMGWWLLAKEWAGGLGKTQMQLSGAESPKTEFKDPSGQVICSPAFPTYQHQALGKMRLHWEKEFLFWKLYAGCSKQESFFSWYFSCIAVFDVFAGTLVLVSQQNYRGWSSWLWPAPDSAPDLQAEKIVLELGNPNTGDPESLWTRASYSTLWASVTQVSNRGTHTLPPLNVS